MLLERTLENSKSYQVRANSKSHSVWTNWSSLRDTVVREHTVSSTVGHLRVPALLRPLSLRMLSAQDSSLRAAAAISSVKILRSENSPWPKFIFQKPRKLKLPGKDNAVATKENFGCFPVTSRGAGSSAEPCQGAETCGVTAGREQIEQNWKRLCV